MSRLREFIQVLGEVGILDGDDKPARILIAMKALRPLVVEPSGSMKACAEEIWEWMTTPPGEELTIETVKYRQEKAVAIILSNHWPVKPELDIEGAAKDLDEAVHSWLLQLEVKDRNTVEYPFHKQAKRILSRYAVQSQGVFVAGLAQKIAEHLAAIIGACHLPYDGIITILNESFTDIGPLKARIAELEKYVDMMGNAAECPMGLTESERFAEILTLRSAALKKGAK